MISFEGESKWLGIVLLCPWFHSPHQLIKHGRLHPEVVEERLWVFYSELLHHSDVMSIQPRPLLCQPWTGLTSSASSPPLSFPGLLQISFKKILLEESNPEQSNIIQRVNTPPRPVLPRPRRLDDIIITSSCSNADSGGPHRCCHLPNSVDLFCLRSMSTGGHALELHRPVSYRGHTRPQRILPRPRHLDANSLHCTCRHGPS